MKAGYNIGIIRTNKTTSIVLGTEYQMMEEFMEQFEIESGQDVISNIQKLDDAKVTFKLVTMSLIGFLHGTSSTLFNTTDLYQTTQFNLNEDLGNISLREYVYSWENDELNELKKKLWAYQEKQGFTDDPLKDKSDEYLKSMDNAVAEANEVAHAIVGSVHNHDNVWRQMAIKIGCDGMRIHNDIKIEKRYLVHCNTCNHTFQQSNKPKSQRSCARCSNKFDTRFILIYKNNPNYKKV